VVPLPQVSIYASPNPLYLPDQATIGANVQNVDTLYWDLGDTVTRFTQIGNYPAFTSNYQDQGTYVIIAVGVNSLGCRTSDTLTLIVYRSMKIFIPNAFTPNGDQTNDFFEIFTDGVESYTMEIFDRWGTLIATLSTNQKWDGTVNGTPAPEGVYVVHVKARGYDGKTVERTASFTLIR
jgi:gliding motility-associated-like protein